jgi:sortase (surface protein transpeptidase)
MPAQSHDGANQGASDVPYPRRPVAWSRPSRPRSLAGPYPRHPLTSNIWAPVPRPYANASPIATGRLQPVSRPAPVVTGQFDPGWPVVAGATGVSAAKGRFTKVQWALTGMACLVFGLGLAVSWQGLRTNHDAAIQIAALSKKAGNQTSPAAPGTAKPSGHTISQYVVAPSLPRYLKIPKLGVDARVLQVGVTASGSIGTPSNVYDTAWYTGSAKPGQAGAMLIDGHVSSWTTHGVFYGIGRLKPGDMMQIVRGDGAVFNYRVVKVETYPANQVDMQAVIKPVTASQPGLNLITCTGRVIKGTDQFSQRVIVFGQQV